MVESHVAMSMLLRPTSGKMFAICPPPWRRTSTRRAKPSRVPTEFRPRCPDASGNRKPAVCCASIESRRIVDVHSFFTNLDGRSEPNLIILNSRESIDVHAPLTFPHRCGWFLLPATADRARPGIKRLPPASGIFGRAVSQLQTLTCFQRACQWCATRTPFEATFGHLLEG